MHVHHIFVYSYPQTA